MMPGLRRVALGLALSFIILSFGLVYWQVIESDALAQHPANRRLLLVEQRVTRGGIFDCNGEILAKTETIDGNKQRVYPKGEMMEPLIGYASLIYGSAGLEHSLADWLLGLRDATPQQQLQRLFDLPRQGNDVVLTIDSRLQQAAYQGLKGKQGAAVAIEPQTGRILAMVSQPSFDPNTLEQKWEEILQTPGSPLANHALLRFPPGSIMKVVTTGALLRAGIDPTELYECTGSTIIHGQEIIDHKAHGWVNLDMAIADSCNTYFATYGVQVGDKLFLEIAKAFGFGQEIPLEIPTRRSALTSDQALPDHLGTNLLAESAFGQGKVLVSPLHMALITAGIANQGVIMKPYLVDRVLDPDQNVLVKSKPESWLNPLTPEEAKRIKSAMIMAVNHGTAKPGAIAGVQVAAKTGSAEPGGDVAPHAWYIAFAPAENPQIAVAVIVENGGTGGGAAAPIAKAIMEEALRKSR